MLALYRYNSVWYNANVLEQKPLLLIMKRRFRPFVLTACRFYVMSLQNFGMVRKNIPKYKSICKNHNERV